MCARAATAPPAGDGARSGSVRLSDGRRLAYLETGDLDGRPVLYFHGAPGSRLMVPDADVSRELGARVIGVDRPGFGRSDPKPDRELIDWPRDVAELAERLGLDRFAVVGTSAGGPHVAACGARISEHITRAGVVGSVAPVDLPGVLDGMVRERRIGAAVARRAPWLLRLLVWSFRNPARDPEGFFERYTRHLPPVDREILDAPAMRRMKIESYVEAVRQGVGGFVREIEILSRPWGFGLDEVRCETHVWHGELDTSAPPAMAEAMARAIPDCRLSVFPGEGHFLMFPRWREILGVLVA